jgi:hypothetical protein
MNELINQSIAQSNQLIAKTGDRKNQSIVQANQLMVF